MKLASGDNLWVLDIPVHDGLVGLGGEEAEVHDDDDGDDQDSDTEQEEAGLLLP